MEPALIEKDEAFIASDKSLDTDDTRNLMSFPSSLDNTKYTHVTMSLEEFLSEHEETLDAFASSRHRTMFGICSNITWLMSQTFLYIIVLWSRLLLKESIHNLMPDAAPWSTLVVYLASFALLSFAMPTCDSLQDANMAPAFVVSLTITAGWIIPLSSVSPHVIACIWPYILAYLNLAVPILSIATNAFPNFFESIVNPRISYGLILVFLIGKAQYGIFQGQPFSFMQTILWIATTIFVVAKML